MPALDGDFVGVFLTYYQTVDLEGKIMAVSWSASRSSSFHCQLFPPLSPATVTLTSNVKLLSSPIRGKPGLSVSRTFLKSLNRATPFGTQQQLGIWEEPDEGSDSDYEDEENGSGIDENDVDFESDWEQDVDSESNIAVTSSSPANDYEEDLVKGAKLTILTFLASLKKEIGLSIENLRVNGKVKYIQLHLNLYLFG